MIYLPHVAMLCLALTLSAFLLGGRYIAIGGPEGIYRVNRFTGDVHRCDAIGCYEPPYLGRR